MAEVKVDGEFVKYDGNRLINDYGTDRTSLIMGYYLRGLKAGLMGEMYYGEGKSFYSEIHAHRHAGQCKLIWFDVAIPDIPYSVRRSTLVAMGVPYVHGEVVHSAEDANIAYKKFVIDDGYEGIVLKPLGDTDRGGWVKIKRRYTCNMYVRGVRKKTSGYGGSKRSIAIGTPERIYGCCSVVGWVKLVELIARQGIIGENNDYWFIEPKIVVEIEYLSLIHKSRKLRNPTIKRIRNPQDTVKEVG
jgi:hypothetical protein